MFDIDFVEGGSIAVTGRLDAANALRAQEFLDQVMDDCVLDLAQLEYISSAGLGVLLRTHKRLMGNGPGVRLVNVNAHIRDIFTYSGFDKLFQIETLDNAG